MREIRSFTLSRDVILTLEEIPRLERSRTVNSILQMHLADWRSGKPTSGIDVEQVRSIVRQMLDARPDATADAGQKETTRALSALAAIVGMREA